MAYFNYSGVSDSRVAPIVGKIMEQEKGQCLVIAPSYIGAKRLASDISFFVNKPVYLVPSDEEIFKSYEAKNKDTLYELLSVLKNIALGEECLVVAPVSMAIKKLAPKEAYLEKAITLEIDKDVESMQKLLSGLVDMGYERVPMVYGKGQFALRGDILDVFTPYADNPVRIEFFDTVVESMRSFDSISQRSIEKETKINLFPARLLVRNEEVFKDAIVRIEKAYRTLPQRKAELIDSVENGTNFQQLDNYIDYFYEEACGIIDYMDDPTLIVDDPNRCLEKVEERYKELKNDFDVFVERGQLVKKDIALFPGKKEYLKLYENDRVYFATPFTTKVKGVETFEAIYPVQSRQALNYNGKVDLLEKDIRRFLLKKYKVTLVCGSEERFDNLNDFLKHVDLDGLVDIKLGYLNSGMEFPEEKVAYITDSDIFGTAKRPKRRRNPVKDKNRQAIKSFSDITTGDFVVHETQGIGKFIGLEQLTVKGEQKDYLKIKYAGNDVLYVPTDQMNLIQKYIGGDVDATRISKLNGKDWKKTKAKAKASVAKMAKELLEVTAKREKAPGFQFGEDTVWQKEFEESFPFNETQDQLRCIEEIKKDMESPKAMDRLLCGDVGYGKTEVAARAMFKCAAEGKQVCVLVPTTILASQHYNTLKARFEKFPFKVEMISRFRSDSEVKRILKDLKSGQVDVVIGTHRLLGSDIEFKDLGLLVIDEEQRFGVSHKEKIKKLKNNVDVLTLSATPIPRTLHMSLLGIRDMSLIEEPPEERYPVQTYVMEQEDYIIKEAIEKEMERGGQVYIINNRVQGIYRVADKISQLVPGVRVGVGHGQMSEMMLEDVMMDFMDGELDVLVATTIVESGIDIPNVNTIIILDADRFGLSQLYQLRGRVGRSNRLAYAYLLHKKNQVLTEVASSRLKAIKSFTEFGAGFKISMRDLEIRGAGNILGAEQSGHMINVGYELYCKLVNDAVKALKGEVVPEKREDTQVLINVSAFIPKEYIADEVTKLGMYKKVMAIETREDYDDIIAEFEDRFGDLPRVTSNLIKVAYVRSLAEFLDVRKVKVEKGKLILDYGAKSGIKPLLLYLEKSGDALKEIIEILELMVAKSREDENAV